jgi:two-component system sensor histidine kinase SenX3
MRATRLSLRLLLPAGLILLVVLLGALQYRWLGQVSEAERAQLQRTLAQRANEFAAEFDREMAVASTVLAIDGDALADDRWAALSAKYDAWHARAMFPGLVRSLYIATATPTGHTLAKWNRETQSGADVDWPEHFAAVRQSISLSIPRPTTTAPPSVSTMLARNIGQVVSMSVSPVVDSVPALVVPIATRPQPVEAAGNVMVSIRMTGTDFVVIELDRAVLTDSLIPALVERFFPNEDANHYRVAVVDRLNDRIFGRGLADADTVDQLHIDAMAVFFTGAHSPLGPRVLAEGRLLAWQMETPQRSTATITSSSMPATAGGLSVFVQERTAAGSVTEARSVRMAMPGWRIMLQHGAGSLDEAVAQARRRNLTTSFGILSVLIVGVGLIVINARKSEKLAAQQMEFVATVSHELRTPLAVIRSAAQNLSAGVIEDPAQAKRYGELIETEGRRLTDMVEEVLEFAGLSGNRRALALRPVDLAWLAQDVIDSHAATLSSLGFRTEVTAAPDLPLVMADEEAIRRALNNLIGNAIKYAADGRSLSIHLSRHDEAGQDDVAIAVTDGGQGIAAEDLPHIFEPFYRGREVVSRQLHGNGLGLSLVSRIAEAHRGSISVRSTPGSGATFTLRLPVGAMTAVES